MTFPIIAPTIASEQRTGLVRRRVLKTGIVAFNGHNSTIVCEVRDLTTTGARLRVEGSNSMNVPIRSISSSSLMGWKRIVR